VLGGGAGGEEEGGDDEEADHWLIISLTDGGGAGHVNATANDIAKRRGSWRTHEAALGVVLLVV
jgi:hypothetical protein